jgi:hypothetical protein
MTFWPGAAGCGSMTEYSPVRTAPDHELPVTTVRNRETKLVSAIFADLRGFLELLPVRRAKVTGARPSRLRGSRAQQAASRRVSLETETYAAADVTTGALSYSSAIPLFVWSLSSAVAAMLIRPQPRM